MQAIYLQVLAPTTLGILKIAFVVARAGAVAVPVALWFQISTLFATIKFMVTAVQEEEAVDIYHY
jgi:ABC-type transport system involved in cytochrome bd biosynthesis fused ATPase/permease subunit